MTQDPSPGNVAVGQALESPRPPTPAPRTLAFETLAIHAGQEPDPVSGAVIVPIYQTSTFVQEALGQHKGYEYGRTGNPTRTALEICLATLEGAQHGLAFATGMGAETTLMYTFKPGDHLLVANDVYGGTYRLFERVLRDYGLDFTYLDLSDPAAIDQHWQPNTRAAWLETPSNPLLKLIDIAAVARRVRARGGRLIVDNTFASPFGQQPLALGADLVVHSTTKYLGGHSDVVGGAIVTNDSAWHEQLKYLQNAVGATPGPFDCWLVLRGIKTLAVRMRAHEANALRLATFLQNHPRVERVRYPGLESNPQYALARCQMRCFGGMVSFDVRGGQAAAAALVGKTRLFALAESLGGVESLIEHPATMTHASVANSPLEIPDNLVRLSVGIEAGDDLLYDLEQALA
ncbi:MAG TPA: cystathionine gamma-synthase [Chloroflexia bacterium]|nr:cystathionine gamma-synthase [Chloroflexia bacterium]